MVFVPCPHLLLAQWPVHSVAEDRRLSVRRVSAYPSIEVWACKLQAPRSNSKTQNSKSKIQNPKRIQNPTCRPHSIHPGSKERTTAGWVLDPLWILGFGFWVLGFGAGSLCLDLLSCWSFPKGSTQWRPL